MPRAVSTKLFDGRASSVPQGCSTLRNVSTAARTFMDGTGRAAAMRLKYLADLHPIGEPLKEPYFGKHFKLPARPRPHELPVFDLTLLYIPIYCHLVLHPPKEITRPDTPDLIIRSRIEKAVINWMD